MRKTFPLLGPRAMKGKVQAQTWCHIGIKIFSPRSLSHDDELMFLPLTQLLFLFAHRLFRYVTPEKRNDPSTGSRDTRSSLVSRKAVQNFSLSFSTFSPLFGWRFSQHQVRCQLIFHGGLIVPFKWSVVENSCMVFVVTQNYL